MESRTINIYEVVANIQARKELAQKVPSHATLREIKAALNGIDEGTIFAYLEAEVDCGHIRRVRTINGYTFGVNGE